MSASYDKYRKIKSGFMTVLSVFCALLVVTPLVLVLFHLLRMGFGSLNWNLFTQLPKAAGEDGGGMANGIVGTLELMGLALVMGVPIGLLGGIYLSEYGSDKINTLIRFGADILNGVPSIVWGLVGYTLVVSHDFELFGHMILPRGYSAFAGGLSLAFIMIPLVLRTTEEVLLLVPSAYREAAMALGIPRWKITVNIVLSTAKKGLITGVLLALGRVAGETAPILFTVLGSSLWNNSIKDPIAALPIQIYYYAISPFDDQNRQAWAGALVLIMIVFLLSASVRILSSRRKRA